MNDRLQRVLDGELAPEALSEAERRDLSGIEALMDRVTRSVPVGSLPDLAGSVMTRIADLPAPGAGGPIKAQRSPIHWLGWLWNPRSVSFTWRPAYGVVGALALVVLLALAPAGMDPDAASVGPPQVLVQFRLDAPRAQGVRLAGDFTGWQQSYELTRSEPGVWTVVVPLEPGVHDYAFIVDDGRWIPDPLAPAVNDGFGGLNSRIAVLAPDAGRPL